MRAIQSIGAVVALLASVFVARIVTHGVTDHGELDVFHTVVAVLLALVGLLLGIRAARRSPRPA